MVVTQQWVDKKKLHTRFPTENKMRSQGQSWVTSHALDLLLPVWQTEGKRGKRGNDQRVNLDCVYAGVRACAFATA